MKWSSISFRHILICGALTISTVSPVRSDQPVAEGRKVFTNSVIPLTSGDLAPHGLVVSAAGETHAQDQLDVLFSLAIPNNAKAALEKAVLKGEVVDPKTLSNEYAPTADNLNDLTKWLKAENLKVTHTSADRTSVYVRATAAQLEKSLHVKMVRVTKNGVTYNAAQNAPSIPLDASHGVQAIIGLQPFRQATKQFRKYRPVGVAAAANAANAPPYLVNQVLAAYQADSLGVTGKGQTIAILIDTFPLDDDTKTFWIKNNIPVDATRVKNIPVKDGPLPPIEGEESLDVQWASGIAKDAKIRVYACGTLSFVDLDLGLDQILEDARAQPDLRQVSISLGIGEDFLSPSGILDGEIATEHQKFLQLAAIGVNVFVSSGDAGSRPDISGHSSGATTQVEWMSSSPFVIGVGGTTLRLTATGAVASEVGWPGSGGGISKIFSRPSYQIQSGMPDGSKRLVPDVSVLADPNTGVFVRINGQDDQFGGTSLSAPVWAGFCALLNESRTNAHKPRLPYLNPLIYPLQNTCFRDITRGTNGGGGQYDALKGFDMVTGLGVPNIKALKDKIGQ